MQEVSESVQHGTRTGTTLPFTYERAQLPLACLLPDELLPRAMITPEAGLA